MCCISVFIDSVLGSVCRLSSWPAPTLLECPDCTSALPWSNDRLLHTFYSLFPLFSFSLSIHSTVTMHLLNYNYRLSLILCNQNSSPILSNCNIFIAPLPNNQNYCTLPLLPSNHNWLLNYTSFLLSPFLSCTSFYLIITHNSAVSPSFFRTITPSLHLLSFNDCFSFLLNITYFAPPPL